MQKHVIRSLFDGLNLKADRVKLGDFMVDLVEKVESQNASPAQLETPATGARIGVIGTSLVQQNDVATTAKISHWSRGWLSWARFFAKGRFECEIWPDNVAYVGWEPSGTAGVSRGFNGQNAGVSGQTVAQITARQQFLADSVDCDIVIVDAGTNDMSPVSKEDIHAARIALAQVYLARGIRVVLLPILSRSVSSWAAGGAERKKAAWINQKTRDFCRVTPNCHFFDWNAAWVDSANANGEPLTGYSNDGIHFAPAGGVAVGEALASFLTKLLPDPFPRVWSADDKFDAAQNPLGNLLPNPFCTGTTGTLGAGVTGTVATLMRAEVSTGNATAVASKEARADGRGDWQVLTITPGAADSMLLFRTNAADTNHTLQAGTWIQASCEVDIGAFNGWQGVSLYLKDNGTGGMLAYDMEPFDGGSGLVKWPARPISNGLLVTPPFQLVSGSATLRWRLEIRAGSTAGGASGTGLLKIGAVELRQVEDPRAVAGYIGA